MRLLYAAVERWVVKFFSFDNLIPGIVDVIHSLTQLLYIVIYLVDYKVMKLVNDSEYIY